MRTFKILLKKDFRELIRTKKILILFLIFIFFGLTSPMIAYYTPDLLKSMGNMGQTSLPKPTILESYDQLIKNFSGLITYLLIVIVAGELVGERKKGQLTTLMNNGVAKSQFVLSKVVTQFVSAILIYLLALAAFAFYNQLLFGKALNSHSGLSFASLLLYSLFIMALTNCFGSFLPSMALTLVASFAGTLLLSLFNLFKFGKYLPNYLITLSSKVVRGQDLTNVWQTLGITFLLTVLLIIASMLLCRHRE